MTALLIRRRRPIGEPAGAGRVIVALAEFGFELEAVQQLALDAVLSPLGSVLVEHHPLDWAETAASVRPTPGGSDLGMVDVRRDAPFVSAVSVYDVGGRVVRQPFRAQVQWRRGHREHLIPDRRHRAFILSSLGIQVVPTMRNHRAEWHRWRSRDAVGPTRRDLDGGPVSTRGPNRRCGRGRPRAAASSRWALHLAGAATAPPPRRSNPRPQAEPRSRPGRIGPS